MTNLDDDRSFALLDTENMAAQIAGLPESCALAWDLAQEMVLPAAYQTVRSIVFLCMGGSAISGDLARTLAADTASVPIEVVRGYDIPGYVDGSTLVIAISFSGNTEETLAALEAAQEKQAMLLAIASGGALAAQAQAADIPLYQVKAASQPRAALPNLYLPVIHALTSLNVFRCPPEEIHGAISAVSEYGEALVCARPESANLAKQVARKLHGRIASIYASEFLSAVARRWKTQMNENSKQWAEFEDLPEANHNAVVGYMHPSDHKGVLSVVQLDSHLYHPRTRLRIPVTGELLEKAGIEFKTVLVPGVSRLAQQLCGILLGDYVSFYLAMLNSVDPTPVAPLDYVKAELSRAQ